MFSSIFACYKSVFTKQKKVGKYIKELLCEKQKDFKGSVTVEASLVLPVFLFTICLFYSFFLILSAQLVIGESLVQTGRFVSQYGAIKEISNNTLKLEFYKNLNTNHLQSSCIQGGRLGVRLLCKRFGEKEENIELSANYVIKFPINIFHIKNIPSRQQIRARLFIGKEMLHTGKDWDNGEGKESIKNEETVYITENGTVYHKNKNCSHIQLTIKMIPVTGLEYARNISGAKYKRCEKCRAKQEGNSTTYITLEGNHYHTSLTCSGLKRTLLEVKLSTVKDWNSCLRCG